MKHKLGRVCCTKYCTKSGIRIAWKEAGVWKLSGIRKGMNVGGCSLCVGNKDAVNIYY
jgi:hypothetical protein